MPAFSGNANSVYAFRIRAIQDMIKRHSARYSTNKKLDYLILDNNLRATKQIRVFNKASNITIVESCPIEVSRMANAMPDNTTIIHSPIEDYLMSQDPSFSEPLYDVIYLDYYRKLQKRDNILIEKTIQRLKPDGLGIFSVAFCMRGVKNTAEKVRKIIEKAVGEEHKIAELIQFNTTRKAATRGGVTYNFTGVRVVKSDFIKN